MLEIKLLGRFDVRLDGQPVDIASRPAQSLLAYLALNANVPHRRELLAGRLWPDTTDANARNSLRHALWSVRHAIGPDREYLVADDLTITLNAGSDCRFDFNVLTQKVDVDWTADDLIGVVSEYGGDLLPGFYDEWVVLERQRLQVGFEHKMKLLLDRLVGEQRWEEVLEWGERWIALGHTPEPAYRALMVAHAGMGDLSKMAVTYRRCVEALKNELGVEPSGRTRAMYERLLRGESPIVSPPATVGLEGGALDRLMHGRVIGRDREFAEAKSLWQRCVSGSGLVLLIGGEPGIGKTRLMRELATLADVSGALVLVGECYSEGGAPYAPIAQIIQEAFADQRVAGDSLTFPDLVLADLITLSPLLRARFPNVPPNPTLDPKAEQQRMFESVVELCMSLSARIPVMLVVEDIHWSDSGTLALLRHLARRLRKSRLLVGLTYREVELAGALQLNELLLELNRERLATHLKLSRLSREQTRDLLAAMFAEEITPEFLEGIFGVTEGNPFFIEEVCKALIEEGKLYRESGRWRRPGMDEIAVPHSVQMAIQARVGKLPALAQDVLRLAAIVGREFDFETLQRASEADDDALIEALEHAERSQIISEERRAGRIVFSFAHALIPATLRESVSGLRRQRMHSRVANAIEARRPEDFGTLAYHYQEAGEEERAWTYMIRAGDQARKVYVNEDAIRFYTEALALTPADHPDRFNLLAARAAIYDLVAQREAQHADVEAMLPLAEKQNDDARRCDALIALADFYLATEHFRAREPAERAAEIARRLGDAVREGHALRRLGEIANLVQLDFLRGRAVLEEAVTRFQKAGLTGEAAICLHNLSITLERLGELSAAEQAAQEANALSRATGDRQQEATGLRRLAVIYGSQDRWAESVSVAQTALALHRELGDREGEGHTLNNLGGVLPDLARLEESEACLRQALEIGETIDSTGIVDTAIGFLVEYHFDRRGDYEAELAFLETQLAKAQSTNNQFLIAKINWLKAGILDSLGQFGMAIELIGAVLATGQLDDTSQSLALSHMARLQAERGEYVQARLNLQDALERWVKTGRHMSASAPHLNLAYAAWLEGRQIDGRAANPALLRDGLGSVQRFIETFTAKWNTRIYATAFMIAAWLYLALDEADKALAHSTEAVRLAAGSPSPLWPEKIFLAHARALRAASREAEADDYLRRAYERVMLVAGKIQDETLRRSWLENVRENREIVAECVARDWAEGWATTPE